MALRVWLFVALVILGTSIFSRAHQQELEVSEIAPACSCIMA
jgi:hypothetical protein